MINIGSNELDVTLGICAATIGILAFANEFPDKKYLEKIKTLPFKLIVFLIATIIGVCATIKKNSLSDEEKLAEKLNSKLEQHQNDLANRKLTDQSNAKIVNTFTSALAKYNFKYDSSQKTIIKLVRDSAKKETKITYVSHPELGIDNIQLKKITNDSLILTIGFFTKQAACYHTVVKTYTAWGEDNLSYHFIPESKPNFINDVLIPLEKVLMLPRIITGDINQIKNGTIYFLFLGYYFDSEGKKFPFQTISTFNLINKEFGTVTEPANSELRKLFKQQRISY
ncbi:MAG: hypothetical protein JWQ66_2614 [Mucilaginibacter sp.]|nr:hypothetical protein [Mucilaginibacter sp.]